MNDELDFSETPSPEQIAQDLSAMGDSVYVIDSMVENGPRGDQSQLEANEEVDRNVRHLEIMLGKPYIADAGRPLGSYQTAITSGQAYIASHGGLPGDKKA
jgi:hypothetical protein